MGEKESRSFTNRRSKGKSMRYVQRPVKETMYRVLNKNIRGSVSYTETTEKAESWRWRYLCLGKEKDGRSFNTIIIRHTAIEANQRWSLRQAHLVTCGNRVGVETSASKHRTCDQPGSPRPPRLYWLHWVGISPPSHSS